MKAWKFVIFLLLVISCLPSINAAVAAPQSPPAVPTAFFANGQLTGANISGFEVVFYQTSNQPPAGYAYAVSAADGKVAINLHDDTRLILLADQTYYIGIVNKGGFGLNQTPITLTAVDIANGFVNLNDADKLGLGWSVKPGEGILDPNGGSLSGTVVDQNGIPLANTTLTITINGTDYTVTTDDKGKFTVNGIPPGTYTVTISTTDLTASIDNITITAGQTTTITEPIKLYPKVPAGTVGFFITREASDIKISWVTTAAPDVYYFVGNGTGQYTNVVDNWVKVLDGASGKFVEPATGNLVDTLAGFSKDINNKFIKHNGQVGKAAAPADTGIPEVYYKGLVAGKLKADSLPQALAVGKVDITLSKGLSNLSALPLIPRDNDISKVIGDQLPNGTKISFRKPTGEWPELSFNGSWSAPYSMDSNYGFWLDIPADSVIFTMVGNVRDASSQIPLYSGLNNLLGSNYPVQIGLDVSNLGASLGVEGGQLSAFETGVWYEPVYINNSWSSLQYKLKPGRGFWIDRKKTGAVGNWDYLKPY